MKKKTKILTGLAAVIAVIAIGAAVYWFSMPSEERNMILFMMLKGDSFDSYEEYQVIDHNAEGLEPTAFKPTAAEGGREDQNVNIVGITEMVKNDRSKMMKKGMVQTTGIEDYTGWQVLADEGAAEGEYPFGPSPLSYYTSGLAANLHTQILEASEVKGVELDGVKVEVLNKFRWDDMMAPDGAGFLDETTTNIIIESSMSEKAVQEIIEIALNSWAAGEALRNETVIEPSLVVNGDHWDDYADATGTSLSVDSFVDEWQLSSVTEIPRIPEYLEPVAGDEEDENLSFDAMANMEFEIFALSESAENDERPYLKKITVSTPTAETWEIYSDELMGNNENPVAPTSLEYFTVGTSLCLTSQTTLVSAMMGLDFTDYRVEQQIDYRQEDINSADMAGYTDTVHSYVLVESDESEERLNQFYEKSLALCFAGEGLKGATDMYTHSYLNGEELR